jgi:hypothetical protein
MDKRGGYNHANYALSLRECGTPRELPRSGGWILVRPIPDTPYHDAMGCYPILSCMDWSQLHADLNEIQDDLVSLSIVTDPFGEYDETYLKKCFTEKVISFKPHYIVDLTNSFHDAVSRHHLRYVRKALTQVRIEICEEPANLIDDWAELYSHLIQRHNIKGIAAFSKEALGSQLRVPGAIAYRALCREQTVGIIVWYIQKDKSYYHLGAFNSDGYAMRASYGLFKVAIDYFAANGVRWLDLGGAAGLDGSGIDGLSQFKRGWSNGTRTAYFCGRIFNHERYSEIVKAKNITETVYFPAYRKGEFS